MKKMVFVFAIFIFSLPVFKAPAAWASIEKPYVCQISIPGDGSDTEVGFGRSRTVEIRNKNTGKKYSVIMSLGKFKIGNLLTVEVRGGGKQKLNSAIEANSTYFSFNLLPEEIGMAISCKKKTD